MKKFLKILGWVFLGYIIAIMTYASGNKIIGTEISPNGKYKLIYRATRFGGILPLYYRHYVELRKIAGNEYLFSEYTDSDDIKNPYNDAHWNGDTIVVRKRGRNKPYKTITDKGKMTFYFEKGFATE